MAVTVYANKPPDAKGFHLGVILRNIFSNWIGYVVTLLVGFLLSPVVVHHLGNTGYGVWTLVVSLTGYFGILDLGIRSSVGRYVARYVALNDVKNVNRTVSTAMAILAAGGLIAALATIALYFGFGAFKVERQYASAAKIALLLAGANISLALPMGAFSAVLISLERFDVMTSVTAIGALIRAALVVVTLNMGYGVAALALITFLESMAEYSIIAYAAKRLYSPLKPSWRHVDLSGCKELFGFGIYRFIWIIANQLIFYTDSVVIGIFLGAGAITYYAIAGSLINYGRNVVSLATDTLYPAATRLDTRQDLAGLQALQILGTKIALLIALPLCLGYLFLGKQFITLWMGKEYAVSAVFLVILTIPQFTSMSQYVSALILAGMAKHRALAYLVLAEGLTNLALSIILVQKIGLIGVAWGTVIPHLISTAVILPLFTLRILKMNVGNYLLQAYVRPIACAIPTAVLCYALSVLVKQVSWGVFGAEVLAVCGFFATLAYFICLTQEQKSFAVRKVRTILQREPILHE